MYNEGKMYSISTLVVVQVLSFQRYLVFLRLSILKLIIYSTGKVERSEIAQNKCSYTVHFLLIIYFCELRMAHSRPKHVVSLINRTQGSCVLTYPTAS